MKIGKGSMVTILTIIAILIITLANLMYEFQVEKLKQQENHPVTYKVEIRKHGMSGEIYYINQDTVIDL